MDVTQWIILGLAVSAVLGVYLYTRRNDGPNPWREMEDGDDELPADNLNSDDAPDILVDPSVADEWEGFKPERVSEPAVATEKSVVDNISPASFKPPKQEVTDAPAQTAPAPQAPATRPQPSPVATAQTDEEQPEQKILVLHVVGRNQASLPGPAIHQALQECQLQFGERDIYHRIVDIAGQGKSLFSIANMLKPGSLNPEQAELLETPGLVMFMLLPGPVDGNKAFHDMLQTAQDLATKLSGVVLDDKRLPLTRQAAQYLIDDIAKMEHRRRLANA